MIGSKSNYLTLILLLGSLQLLSNLNVGSAAEQEVSKEARRQSLFSRIGNAVQRTIATEREYIALLKRYESWYKQYNALKKPGMKEAREVLLAAYGEADDQLHKEACKETPEDDSKTDDTVSFDHIHRALKMMIDNLEKSIVDLEQGIGMDPMDIESGQADSIESEELTKRALERIKNSAVAKAKEYATGEAMKLANIALMNTAASYIEQQAVLDPSSPIGMLAPIMGVLGSANLPLLTCYLRNIEFRTAWRIISSLRPIVCKLN